MTNINLKNTEDMKQYATYLRVSTQKQGRTMLGIEAQRKMCQDFVSQNNGNIKHEFMDIESGTHRNRKGLQDAIVFCKVNNCPLIIAKLDRLARDVEFCFKVINTGIEIHFCDMPTINTLLLGVFASVAQYERELTSDRTKKALAAKRARGEKLGGACDAWQESYKNKNENEIKKTAMARGNMKRIRHQQSRDMVAFKMVLKKVFPRYTKSDNPADWQWAFITTKETYRKQILSLMEDYKALDDNLFKNWDFNDAKGFEVQKLRNYLSNFKRSYTN